MDFYLFVIILLFLLAIGDLIVGVSNDAVNFLNSAIGSRVASYRVIIFVAMLGIVIGAMFSSGIMEIARKGIFNPELFTFDKVIIIFLAVMLTDIILLDVFNTLGLPTSTTVSIVFELLGAALATGILFAFSKDDPINTIFSYINISSTFSIISGIFLSIIIAFTAGTIIQYLSRLLFTFQYERKVKSFGAVFSGLGLTAIVYFLLIKGLKGTTLISQQNQDWITGNTAIILVGIFLFTTLLCLVLQRTAKVNPLRIVVLAGTFSLAMAFAGNDLVNFIGVPISGFLAYQNWMASGVPADQMYQTYLSSNDVIVPNYMLFIAGVIMALTIWLSAKAKKVTETEVNLGRQDEGDERFRPNAVSRSIVNTSLMLGNVFGKFIPENTRRKYNISFQKSKMRIATNVQEKSAFDLVRAANNLIIASILIAWATSMKLPLSTTYVSFMVAMGSSLADKAWGRDSAVYRVAGVLSVIGGWFITAFIAFTCSALFAFILYKGGQTGTIILAIAVLIYIIISHVSFSRKEKKDKLAQSKLMLLERSDINVVDRNRHMVAEVVKEVADNYDLTMKGLQLKDLSLLEMADKNLSELVQYSYKVRSRTIRNIRELQTDDTKVSEILIYSSDFIQDIVQSAKYLSNEGLYYVKNLHELSDVDFLTDLVKTNEAMNELFSKVAVVLNNTEEYDFNEIKALRDTVRTSINNTLEREVKAINQHKSSTKLSGLKTTVYLQSRDIQAVLMRIVRLYARYDKKIVQVEPQA